MKEAVTEPLRPSIPENERTWLTVAYDTENDTSEIAWHENEEVAIAVAEYDLGQARVGGYNVNVFVLKCVRQGSHRE